MGRTKPRAACCSTRGCEAQATPTRPAAKNGTAVKAPAQVFHQRQAAAAADECQACAQYGLAGLKRTMRKPAQRQRDHHRARQNDPGQRESGLTAESRNKSEYQTKAQSQAGGQRRRRPRQNCPNSVQSASAALARLATRSGHGHGHTEKTRRQDRGESGGGEQHGGEAQVEAHAEAPDRRAHPGEERGREQQQGTNPGLRIKRKSHAGGYRRHDFVG